MPRSPKASAEDALLDTHSHVEALMRRDLKIAKAFCSPKTLAYEEESIRSSYERLLMGIAKALAVVRGDA